MSNTVSRTYKLAPSAVEKVDELAEGSSRSKSEIVEDAILAYSEEASLGGIDSKLNDVMDELGIDRGTPSEKNQDKEKDSTADADRTSTDKPAGREETWGGYSDEYLSKGPLPLTDKQQPGKANRIFNLLILEADSETVPEAEIVDAIETINGVVNDYHKSTYIPLVEDRFRAQGWSKHPVNNIWFESDENIKGSLKAYWDEIEEYWEDNRISAEMSTSTLETLADNRSQLEKQFVKHELADRETVVMALDTVQTELERRV